nr:hypothetical protein [uncultured Blautia sp.]
MYQSEREVAVKRLQKGILEEKTELDKLLWDALLAGQGEFFNTSSGLPFSYVVKRKRNGEYSGELLVSRKESSKTLTRSSVLLAFHKVIDATQICDIDGKAELILPEYKGPKAIGQIFGISYIYSIFWKFGLIRVPVKVQEKLIDIE